MIFSTRRLDVVENPDRVYVAYLRGKKRVVVKATVDATNCATFFAVEPAYEGQDYDAELLAAITGRIGPVTLQVMKRP